MAAVLRLLNKYTVKGLIMKTENLASWNYKAEPYYIENFSDSIPVTRHHFTCMYIIHVC